MLNKWGTTVPCKNVSQTWPITWLSCSRSNTGSNMQFVYIYIYMLLIGSNCTPSKKNIQTCFFKSRNPFSENQTKTPRLLITAWGIWDVGEEQGQCERQNKIETGNILLQKFNG